MLAIKIARCGRLIAEIFDCCSVAFVICAAATVLMLILMLAGLPCRAYKKATGLRKCICSNCLLLLLALTSISLLLRVSSAGVLQLNYTYMSASWIDNGMSEKCKWAAP